MPYSLYLFLVAYWFQLGNEGLTKETILLCRFASFGFVCVATIAFAFGK